MHEFDSYVFFFQLFDIMRSFNIKTVTDMVPKEKSVAFISGEIAKQLYSALLEVFQSRSPNLALRSLIVILAVWEVALLCCRQIFGVSWMVEITNCSKMLQNHGALTFQIFGVVRFDYFCQTTKNFGSECLVQTLQVLCISHLKKNLIIIGKTIEIVFITKD